MPNGITQSYFPSHLNSSFSTQADTTFVAKERQQALGELQEKIKHLSALIENTNHFPLNLLKLVIPEWTDYVVKYLEEGVAHLKEEERSLTYINIIERESEIQKIESKLKVLDNFFESIKERNESSPVSIAIGRSQAILIKRKEILLDEVAAEKLKFSALPNINANA